MHFSKTKCHPKISLTYKGYASQRDIPFIKSVIEQKAKRKFPSFTYTCRQLLGNLNKQNIMLFFRQARYNNKFTRIFFCY